MKFISLYEFCVCELEELKKHFRYLQPLTIFFSNYFLQGLGGEPGSRGLTGIQGVQVQNFVLYQFIFLTQEVSIRLTASFCC